MFRKNILVCTFLLMFCLCSYVEAEPKGIAGPLSLPTSTLIEIAQEHAISQQEVVHLEIEKEIFNLSEIERDNSEILIIDFPLKSKDQSKPIKQWFAGFKVEIEKTSGKIINSYTYLL